MKKLIFEPKEKHNTDRFKMRDFLNQSMIDNIVAEEN